MFGFRTDKTKDFWRWLTSQRAKIEREVGGTSAVQDRHWSIHELGRRLKEVNENLVHEIGMPDASTVELIISADGIKAAFPQVIELVKRAPILPGFKITAFRPRCGDGLQLKIAGKTITDEMLTYRLIAEEETLGLELFVDCDLTDQTRSMVGFLSLDQRLGEFDVATGLTWIEFSDGRPANARPITGLARDFDDRRGLAKH